MRRHSKSLVALAFVLAVACISLAMVAPRLASDEAIRQLMLTAEWQHRRGRHDAAAALYASALDQIDRRDGRTHAAMCAEDEPAGRLDVLHQIQRCVGEIDNLEVAADVALPVISSNPWISFHHRNFAIAQVAFRRAAVLGSRPWENDAARQSNPRRKEAWYLLRLAQRRLDLDLAGPGETPVDSRAVESLRARIAEAFATGELPTASETDRF